jgi:hypothetical protein
MTTAIKTAGCRTNNGKMMTELVCCCGNRLKVSVKKDGWIVSLWATGLANRWLVELDKLVDHGWAKEFAARCPKCRVKPCQCRDC